MFVIQAVGSRRHGRADGRAVLDQADANALQILHEPIVIERHRTNDIGPAGKGDDADAIVRPAFDKLARDFANGVEPRRLIEADR